MPNHQDDSWNRLLKAAKKSGAGTESGRDSSPPDDFVSRMRSARKALWGLARTLLWRRWSLVAIAVAAALYLIVWLVLKDDPAPLIPPPEPPNPLSR
jgi:hypothetical protein